MFYTYSILKHDNNICFPVQTCLQNPQERQEDEETIKQN